VIHAVAVGDGETGLLRTLLAYVGVTMAALPLALFFPACARLTS
jgi:hypothetical protein